MKANRSICVAPGCNRGVHSNWNGALSDQCAVHIVRAGGTLDWQALDDNPLVCVCAAPELDGWSACTQCRRKPLAAMSPLAGEGTSSLDHGVVPSPRLPKDAA